jgi:hypothetical protein
VNGDTQPIVWPATLKSEHLDSARLFADRNDLVRSLHHYRGGRIAEVGVAIGFFSRVLLDELRPTRFDAIDFFSLPETQVFWRYKLSEIFQGRTHKEYIEWIFASEIQGGIFHVLQGDSSTQLSLQEDASYDLIYFDADHTYDGLSKDVAAALPKLKPDGLLVFNDYIMYDFISHHYYGVIHIVNDLCVKHGWKITHFALQNSMWCDVAICRKRRR